MYIAILKRKNGLEITKHISRIISYIDIEETDNQLNLNIEEYIDLTPDNIINKGGFSEVIELKMKRTRFILSTNVSLDSLCTKLIYKEL